MKMFNTIEDPTRLLPGDVILVDKPKNLRLAPDTLRRYGVSLGSPSRAINNEETVQHLYTDLMNNLNKVAYVVALVEKPYSIDNVTKKYKNFFGNSTTCVPAERTQQIRRATIVPVPYDDLVGLNATDWNSAEALRYVPGMNMIASTVIDSTTPKSDIFLKTPRYQGSYDTKIDDMSEILGLKTNHPRIPTYETYGSDRWNPSDQEVIKQTVKNSFFDRTNRQQSLRFPPKTFKMMASKGARFLRPTEDFKRLVAKAIAVRLSLDTSEEACGILDNAKQVRLFADATVKLNAARAASWKTRSRKLSAGLSAAARATLKEIGGLK